MTKEGGAREINIQRIPEEPLNPDEAALPGEPYRETQELPFPGGPYKGEIIPADSYHEVDPLAAGGYPACQG